MVRQVAPRIKPIISGKSFSDVIMHYRLRVGPSPLPLPPPPPPESVAPLDFCFVPKYRRLTGDALWRRVGFVYIRKFKGFFLVVGEISTQETYHP